jgi:hypothetical protein
MVFAESLRFGSTRFRINLVHLDPDTAAMKFEENHVINLTQTFRNALVPYLLPRLAIEPLTEVPLLEVKNERTLSVTTKPN